METKKCKKCGEEKPASAEYFYTKRNSLEAKCKTCRLEQMKKYREENRDKINKRERERNRKNRDHVRKRHKAWIDKQGPEWSEKERERKRIYREENRDKINAKAREDRENNLEERREAYRKWCSENRDKTREYGKKSFQKHKQKRYEYRKTYRKERAKKDPIYRLLENTRTRMWHGLKGGKVKKNEQTFKYIGMNPESLMDYLESLFTEGMTRDNYGKWHVDHIRPLASYDFTGPDREDQLYKAWNYTNLQPLWAKDNMEKSAKWENHPVQDTVL